MSDASIQPVSSSCLSPILFDSPEGSSVFWACTVILGIGLILAAYDPANVSFLGSQASKLDIYACYSAGGLITLVSSIQLIRLIAHSRSLTLNPNDVQEKEANDNSIFTHTTMSSTATAEPASSTDPAPPTDLRALLNYIRRVPWRGHSPYELSSDGHDRLRVEAHYIILHMRSQLESAMRAGQHDLIPIFVKEAWDLLKVDFALHGPDSTISTVFTEVLCIVSRSASLANQVMEIYKRDDIRIPEIRPIPGARPGTISWCWHTFRTALSFCIQQAATTPSEATFQKVRNLIQQCDHHFRLQFVTNTIDELSHSGDARERMYKMVEDHRATLTAMQEERRKTAAATAPVPSGATTSAGATVAAPANLEALLDYVRRASWKGEPVYTSRDSTTLRPEANYIYRNMTPLLETAMKQGQDDLIVAFAEDTWELLKTDDTPARNTTSILFSVFKTVLHIVSTNETLLRRVIGIYNRRDANRAYHIKYSVIMTCVERTILDLSTPNIMQMRNLIGYCCASELTEIRMQAARFAGHGNKHVLSILDEVISGRAPPLRVS